MLLSENFTLDELTKSQEAIRLEIKNTPEDEHITNLILLSKNILQPVRNHFKIPVVSVFHLDLDQQRFVKLLGPLLRVNILRAKQQILRYLVFIIKN
jgi:hypothetical protein